MANKLKIASSSFLTLSILLLVAMLIKIYIDYRNFINHPEWSAPFSAYLLTTGVFFGVPTIVSFVIALFLKTKASK
ncbi:hypothetical protein DRW41_04745 [Neobacillus piezotolerans]|uniref:Uncharacterized protein n=1 Tax=Neobacillus piezotolerans TaxID=2259171 RepID=A0A3D8GXE3_9BACI|nr:hypothetical protein [Neobacillus piezotolerans]RDU38869.1 hypothetical protein DRW41_04745 [Neobacillus piezotolerans]